MYDFKTLAETLGDFNSILKHTVSKAVKVLVILFGLYLFVSFVAAALGMYWLFGIWYFVVGGIQ